jgi:hypothetical protein
MRLKGYVSKNYQLLWDNYLIQIDTSKMQIEFHQQKDNSNIGDVSIWGYKS